MFHPPSSPFLHLGRKFIQELFPILEKEEEKNESYIRKDEHFLWSLGRKEGGKKRGGA